MKQFILAAAFLSSPSYAFICGLGTCTQQCTSPDSAIGEQPLPSSPDLNNGNYVDCVHACIDLKEQLSCSDGTPVPWLEGVGDNLDKGYLATVPIFEKGTFRAYAEPGFTPMDRSQLKEAFEIAWEQLGVLFLNEPMNSEFGKCAKGSFDLYAFADLWGATFWDKNTYGNANIWRTPRVPNQAGYIPGFPGIKYDVRVVRLWDDSALGRAQLGNPGVARPVIALNWNYLKGYTIDAAGQKIRNSALAHPASWAKTIVHEILHTVGHNHQDSINWKDPADVAKYNNTPMIHFSDCIRAVALPTDLGPYSKLSLKE